MQRWEDAYQIFDDSEEQQVRNSVVIIDNNRKKDPKRQKLSKIMTRVAKQRTKYHGAWMGFLKYHFVLISFFIGIIIIKATKYCQIWFLT